jgi:UDP-3-O-[3-hydroxymyristoyl] glucosamine N-acyltransferase
MEHPGFFERAGPIALRVLAEKAAATLPETADGDARITDVRGLADAGAGHVSFLDNRKYLSQLDATHATAVFVAEAFASRVPAGSIALVTRQPYRAFAFALQTFYPGAMRPKIAEADHGSPLIHPTARIEDGAIIEPGAVIGREAEIGRGTLIAANAVIGYRCTVGRDSFIGPHASIAHSLIGDRVIIHAGARIGQDGFGFAMGAQHLKVPQIGRVIIQDDVEIGANTGIDRGALKDTIIGEGSKIDNLVQIGHNCVIGRHCVICGQVGLAGSTVLEDYVVMGGASGAAGHLTIGAGTQVAGAAHVKDSLPPRSKVGGTPAKPFRVWARELGALTRLGAQGFGDKASEPDKDG